MCIIFLSYKRTPGYKLVLAANRDEFLDRPTAPLDYFGTGRKILAGRDLKGGGTWLGVDQSGRLAAITNYRDNLLSKDEAPSRGEIITDFLSNNVSVEDYIAQLALVAHKYNGFNLLLFDSHGLYYFANRGNSPSHLTSGFYGLSNGLLDSNWPKVSRGKKLLSPYLLESAVLDQEQIFTQLQDRQRPDDEDLPDTGVGLQWERMLSSIFIDEPIYGTRSSAFITIDLAGNTDFYEQNYLRRDGNIHSSLVSYHMNV